MRKFSVRRLTTDAILVALYYVLATLTPIKTGSFKFTFEALPVLIGALLLGPADGLIIGGLGSFLYQILSSGYGITATTALWILPHAASGLAVGLYGKKLRSEPNFLNTAIICLISALLVTALNTLALYVDSKLYGYYSKTLVFGALGFKVLAGAILSALFAAVLPKLLKALRKFAAK